LDAPLPPVISIGGARYGAALLDLATSFGEELDNG
jgi:hypothetical protein